MSILVDSPRAGRITIEPEILLEPRETARLKNAAKRLKGKALGGTAWWFPSSHIGVVQEELVAAGFSLTLTERASKEAATTRERVDADVAHAQENIVRANTFLARLGLSLWDFQVSDIPRIAASSVLAVCHGVGLGKAGMVLSATPAREGGPGMLVCCPADICDVWVEEAEKFRPDLRVTVVKRTVDARWPESGELVVLSFGRLPPTEADQKRARSSANRSGKKAPATALGPSVTAMAREVPPGTVLVADEGHYLSNWKAQRTRRFRTLCGGVRKADGKVWVLSATPMENAPHLAGLLRALGVFELLFGTGLRGKENFESMFNARRNFFGGVTWGRMDPALPGIIAPFVIRRSKEECFPDLPPVLRQIVPVPKTDSGKALREVRRRLKEAGLPEDSVAQVLGGSGRSGVHLNRKVLFATMSALRRDLSIAKTPFVLRYLDLLEAGDPGPLLVCSCHRAPIEAIGAREGWATIVGGMPKSRATEIRHAFQEGQLKGLAFTAGTIAEGVTLTAGHRMLLVDVPWEARKLVQLEGRLRPHLQGRRCHYYYVTYDHPVDRRVLELLFVKLETAEDVLDGVEEVWASGSANEVRTRRLDASGKILRGPGTVAERLTLRRVQRSKLPAAQSLRAAWERNGRAWSALQWSIATRVAKKAGDDAQAG